MTAANINPIYRFNTQPPEGGWSSFDCCLTRPLSFNTQPPEGGWAPDLSFSFTRWSFNTQPPEGGWLSQRFAASGRISFQHTAA